MEGELAPQILDRVAGVVATLIPDHHIGLLAQQVGDFTLAFVTPLGAHHDENRHIASRSVMTSLLLPSSGPAARSPR
jgi:hypothetical protein